MTKKILIISQYFYPEDFRINDIALELKKLGYQVKILTGIPNYPEGKFYDGFHLLSNNSGDYHGMEVIRLPIISRGSSSIRMVINYISFVISGCFFIMTTSLKPDIIFTYEVSPMTQALIGPWLAKKTKAKTILYVLDLWPENIEVAAGIKNRFILNSIRRMVSYIYHRTDRILASSKSFVQEIMSFNLPKDKVLYWPQYGEEIYVPIIKDSNEYRWVKDKEKLIIGFTGNIGNAQGLQILPEVASILKKNEIDLVFLIVGDGRAKDALIQSVNRLDVHEYFQFIDRQPSNYISDILAEVDVAFLSFDDNPIYEKTIPAKIQTYMACGKPILVSATGEVERIVSTSKAGLTCPAGDAQGLANTIQKLKELDKSTLDQMSVNSREFFDKHFSKENLMEQLDKIIQEVLKE
ncbi:MAG: glycosyltransferase family 4 protein [Facklamia hominis]